MKLFFKKELPDRPLVLSGRKLTFHFLELEDTDPLVPLLRDCVRKQVGGVRELTEEQYAESKKALSLPRSSKTLSKMPREEVGERLFPQGRGVGARFVEKVDSKPAQTEPLQLAPTGSIDFEQFKPTTAKGIFN